MTAIKEILQSRIKDFERDLEKTDPIDILSIQLIEADIEKLERNLLAVEEEK